MIYGEIVALNRAHQMFVGSGGLPALNAGTAEFDSELRRAAELNDLAAQGHYQQAVHVSRAALLWAARTDAAGAAVIAAAHQDHTEARQRTKSVLDAARAEGADTPVTPMAHREALRRRVARLRAQHGHVVAARRRAQRRQAALRALRYRMPHHRGPDLRRLELPAASGRAGTAVRAALSRLGRPYVWGATGPDQFDCSGLVQWAYAQAGIHLDRTTYQQINDGVFVPRSQVRPGDLVFPHPGHVQLAIGNNLVVEAPYSGASVRISPLGSNVQIRRPLWRVG